MCKYLHALIIFSCDHAVVEGLRQVSIQVTNVFRLGFCVRTSAAYANTERLYLPI